MKKILNPNDYQQTLFRLDVLKGRVTGMLSDFIMTGSLSLGDPIITFDGAWWSLRLLRKSETKVAQKGLELFKSKESYTKYAKDFRAYIKETEKNIVPKYKIVPDKIDKKEFSDLIKNLRKFWYLYGITEGVYHDLAHKEMLKTQDPTLEKNLADLEKLKFEGRALLNSFILEDGLINNVLKCISKMFDIDGVVTKYFYPDELEGLFLNKKPDIEEIKKRTKAFVVHIKGEIYRLEYNEADVVAQSFTKFEQAEYEESRHGLKGNIANKGKVTGMVVISPMLDMKAAMEVEKRMKKGDILVVQSTNPDLMALCSKAGAIITDQGGMLSHAAIISRELGVPCIVGTINGTKVFKDGDMVEVDADNGVVRIIK